MVTKNGIHLLNANQITNLITKIEFFLPGYWYSLSQKKDVLRISMGPGPECLLDLDRAFARTKEGDNGFIFDLGTAGGFEQSTTELVEQLNSAVAIKRNRAVESVNELPARKGPHRHHNPGQREAFRKRYGKFLRSELEICEDVVILDEVYIGACTLSSDVSLRGKNIKTNRPVDVSVDLTGRSTLADALNEAISEVLTIREKHRTLGLKLT